MTNKKVGRYLLIDKATLIYMAALSLLILIFHANLSNWMTYIAFNLGICVAVVLVANGLNHKVSRWMFFIRHWYPLLFFTLLYEETRNLVHLIFPQFFDPLINRLELAVFGVYPTVWMQKFICFGASEYLMFSYSFYYFLLVVLGVGLFFSNKIKEFDDLLFTSAVAYYISYLGFILFPVEGPRFALVSSYQVEINGGFFTSLAHGLIDVAGIRGGAMPSSHVAVALVVLVYARRHHRILYYVLSPLIASLLISTVYGRFHYISDVVAGLLVGGGSILLCDRLIKKKSTMVRQEMVEKEISLDLARSD
ncbi:MAG: phosphatase PAP2 family protein [candidate division Zixibacteria bacterium]|nr:phosphatase PAP2 family protein [candidate division Zixibacteria bacterium]